MKRSEQKATVTDIIKTVQLADQLVKLGLLRLDLENFAAHFYPEVWDGKDDMFIRNWCKNIAQAIFAKTGSTYNPNKVLKLYSLAMAGKPVGTFSIKSGLVRARESEAESVGQD